MKPVGFTLAGAFCAFVFGGCASGFEPAAASPAARSQAELTCVEYWPEARYRNYGYDHIVHLHNGCNAAARCIITTDVNPEPHQVHVPTAATVHVVTFRGSPAREFQAFVSCELHEPVAG